MSPRSPAPIALLWGEDPFLLREAALARLGDVRPTEVDAEEWQGGELQATGVVDEVGGFRLARGTPGPAVLRIIRAQGAPILWPDLDLTAEP